MAKLTMNIIATDNHGNKYNPVIEPSRYTDTRFSIYFKRVDSEARTPAWELDSIRHHGFDKLYIDAGQGWHFVNMLTVKTIINNTFKF